MTPARLKVLVVAAAVHPDKGSEPGLGWGWVSELALHHDIWAIVGEKEGNRAAIERETARRAELQGHLRVHFIPRPEGGPLERLIPLLYYQRYRRWHRKAFDLATRLAAEIPFDLAHQLNMTGFREPGYLWRLDLPFVWGPVGGTANVPLRFAAVLGPGAFLYHLAKVTVNNVQLRTLPRVRAAVRRADGFVTSTSDTRRAFLAAWRKDSLVVADTGPPATTIGAPPKSMSPVFRIAWSGLHLSRKALPLLLAALRDIRPDRAWRLEIVGAGPMTGRWRRLAERFGIAGSCTWHGWLSRDAACRVIGQADLFAFLSLHEGVPTVVFEALALDVPVLCLDTCGQGDVVDDTCGIKIPLTTPREVVRQTAAALERLIGDDALRARLAAGCAPRLSHFSWRAKAQQMGEVYREAIRTRRAGRE